MADLSSSHPLVTAVQLKLPMKSHRHLLVMAVPRKLPRKSSYHLPVTAVPRKPPRKSQLPSAGHGSSTETAEEAEPVSSRLRQHVPTVGLNFLLIMQMCVFHSVANKSVAAHVITFCSVVGNALAHVASVLVWCSCYSVYMLLDKLKDLTADT